MLKILDPPLLVRIYFTTPQHKNIDMIHGMRGYQKVAKSCNKIYIPEHFTPKYIYICVCQVHALCGAKATQRAKTGQNIVVVVAPSWASVCSRLICKDTLILNSAAVSLAPKTLCLAEWVLLVRCHLPGRPLIHQPERLVAPASASSCSFSSFFLIFLFQNHFSWSQ